jgi:hypothetical protein
MTAAEDQSARAIKGIEERKSRSFAVSLQQGQPEQ